MFLKITKLFFWKFSQRINLWFFDKESKTWTLFECDSKNTFCQIWLEWNLFFQIWHKELNFFWVWLKEWNFFQKKKIDSQNWTFFLRTWRKELNPSFLEYDASNWTFFQNMTQRVELFLKFLLIWLKDLNSFCWYDSKKWTLFEIWLTELSLFLKITERIELLFLTRLEELSFFVEYDSKNWTFLNTTQRI